jgi:hypothetical protein
MRKGRARAVRSAARIRAAIRAVQRFKLHFRRIFATIGN